MTSFRFQGFSAPFARWMGPYSPSRGTYYGFRVRDGDVGTWMDDRRGVREFLPLAPSSGARDLADLVLRHFGGGRILLLPFGLVIKPLAEADEIGKRVVIGRFAGPVVVSGPNGRRFDFSAPGRLKPGDPWQGPGTTGLECTLTTAGALECCWYHPSRYGREETRMQLVPPQASLLNGFRRARPGDSAGRVRVTANGLVTTNRQEYDGSWSRWYVGQVPSGAWVRDAIWVSKEKL